jgi:hypothetical protein
MLRHLRLTCLLFTGLAAAAPPLASQGDSARVDREISGTVYDMLSRKPIPYAIIRVAETDSSTITDRKGFYQLRVPVGNVTLEFRQIGYTMTAVVAAASEDDIAQDVFMNRLAVDLDTVVISGVGESRATQIIRRAIARKNDVLARIRDYNYQAYVKLVISDLAKDQDSADAVLIMTETETTAYWEAPDKYQEIITARRQTSNLAAEQNLVSVGQIVNFNRDRIDVDKYLVVSPTADDALDHYRYHLVDSLVSNDRKIYRLAIVPNTDGAPLFAGMIDIADSTYDVVAIDVRFNDAVRFDFFNHLRYRQRLRDYGNDHWMPYEITFSGEIHFGIPIPGVPRHLAFRHQASLSDFHFDQGNVPVDIGTFLVVVDEGADEIDSTAWEGREEGRLTEVERAAYARIDSIRSRPASIGSVAATGLGLALFMSTNPDFFHFNRTESVYLGAGWIWQNLSPNLTLRTKLGYSLGRNSLQYEVGAWYRVFRWHDVWVGGSYRDDIVSRPTIVSSLYNPTYLALLMRLDPLEYYRAQGFNVSLSGRLFSHARLEVQYNDYSQQSVPVVTDYSILNVDREVPPNPDIDEGRLRSVETSLTYDSRPMVRQKGRDIRLNALTYTRVTAAVEYSSPRLFATDFRYGRYSVRLKRRQRTFNWGLTTIDAYVGASSGSLPRQRYFTVDFGKGAFFEEGGFSTMHEVNFFGNRAAMIVVSHNFDRLLFQKSGIPLIERLPFTLAIHGGVFWTGFVDHIEHPGDDVLATAPTAYSEVGFGIGNLTPFISPLNLAIYFSWQLSSYQTEGFKFRIGVPTP